MQIPKGIPKDYPPIPQFRKPHSEIKRAIDFLDLDPVKFILTQPTTLGGYGWDEEFASKVLRQYRRFLLLKATCGKHVIPTNEIDEAWHAHMFDTRKYLDDCIDCFGEILHHFPYLGMRGGGDVDRLTEAFEETCQLYESAFNEPFGIRTELAGSSADAANCG
ncbi:MAG TPA: hypothetical protein VFT82_00240 [Candidatus Paceibacterota bacterium]|nr:hypothetical protein [Candidatus Paceibacterota bacterium]